MIDKELEQNFFNSLEKRFKNDIVFRAYEKGKKVGAIEELEKIKDEIKEMSNANPSYWHTCDVVDRADLIDTIDEHIAELKGE